MGHVIPRPFNAEVKYFIVLITCYGKRGKGWGGCVVVGW